MGAKICALRALALLQRSLGSLERIKAIPRVNVYVLQLPKNATVEVDLIATVE
jgi:hypothetical protein